MSETAALRAFIVTAVREALDGPVPVDEDTPLLGAGGDAF